LDVIKKYIHPIIATLMAAGMAGYAGWEESHNQVLKMRGLSPEGQIAFASLLGALGTIGTYGTIYAMLTSRGVPQRPARVIAHAAEDESGIEMVENPTHQLQRQPSYQSVEMPPTPVRGSGPLPELSILQQIAKAAYSTSPPQTIGPFKLRSATPTLKFYVLPDPEDQRHIDTLVVGIRGTNTSDKQDLYADAKLGLGQLEDTPRWKKDLADFNAVMSRLRDPQSVDVYGVGHSLGGAVLDMFLKKGLIKQGVSYNPAISMGDAQKDIPNRRIYQDGDPLLAIMGRSAKNVEVRPKKVKEQSVGRKIANAFSYFIPYVGLVTKGMDTLDAHALDNFTGGTHRVNVIKKLGLKDEGHSLTELAKASKIPRKTLQEVYNRGIGAYTTNPSSVRMKGTFKKGVSAPMSQKLSKEQWAMARVYSFIDGNPKHDTDLRGGASSAYLRKARANAKAYGLDPKKLKLGDGKHKFSYDGVGFGLKSYNDFLLLSAEEKAGRVPKGTAEKKRKQYRARAEKIKGDWKENKISPNNLAIHILWT
jgi:hypothetical protein